MNCLIRIFSGKFSLSASKAGDFRYSDAAIYISFRNQEIWHPRGIYCWHQKIIGYTTAQIDDQYIGIGMIFTGSHSQNNPIRTQTIRAFIAIYKRQSHLRTNRYNGN